MSQPVINFQEGIPTKRPQDMSHLEKLERGDKNLCIWGKEEGEFLYDLLSHKTPRKWENVACDMIFDYIKDYVYPTEERVKAIWGESKNDITMLVHVGDVAKHRTMFICHTDTRHNSQGLIDLYVDKVGYIYGATQSGGFPEYLGAESRAGIFLMCQMIKEGIPGLYVFAHGYHDGNKGAKLLKLEHREYLFDAETREFKIDKCISFDSPGYVTITDMCCGIETASADFTTHLGSLLTETTVFLPTKDGAEREIRMPYGFIYQRDTTEDTVSSSIFEEYVAECSSISVAYHMSRTKSECLDSYFFLHWLVPIISHASYEELTIAREPSMGQIRQKKEEKVCMAGTDDDELTNIPDFLKREQPPEHANDNVVNMQPKDKVAFLINKEDEDKLMHLYTKMNNLIIGAEREIKKKSWDLAKKNHRLFYDAVKEAEELNCDENVVGGYKLAIKEQEARIPKPKGESLPSMADARSNFYSQWADQRTPAQKTYKTTIEGNKGMAEATVETVEETIEDDDDGEPGASVELPKVDNVSHLIRPELIADWDGTYIPDNVSRAELMSMCYTAAHILPEHELCKIIHLNLLRIEQQKKIITIKDDEVVRALAARDTYPSYEEMIIQMDKVASVEEDAQEKQNKAIYHQLENEDMKYDNQKLRVENEDMKYDNQKLRVENEALRKLLAEKADKGLIERIRRKLGRKGPAVRLVPRKKQLIIEGVAYDVENIDVPAGDKNVSVSHSR